MLYVDVEFYAKGKVEGKIKFQNVNMEFLPQKQFYSNGYSCGMSL